MTIPTHAERINGMPFLTATRSPSRFMPGQTTLQPTFTCSCGHLRADRPKHGVPFKCEGCGVSMAIDGCDLLIWRDEPVSA